MIHLCIFNGVQFPSHFSNEVCKFYKELEYFAENVLRVGIQAVDNNRRLETSHTMHHPVKVTPQ